MNKKPHEPDELAGVQWQQHGGGSGNRRLPRVVPIVHGEVLAVYPDDATVEVMRSEKWAKVRVGFINNADGEFSELVLAKSEAGLNVRFYRRQRPTIHVNVRRRGRAVARAEAKACSVRRVGDAFVFDVLDQVSIVPPEA
jgi:hypothetical protein